MVVAATGFFDGVHLGHSKVIEALCKVAKAEGKKSAIITFWPHPRGILRQDAESLRLLTTTEEKRQLCISKGVDEFHVIEFTRELSRLSAEEFISQYLIARYNVSTLIIGYDHRLGHGTDGTGIALEATAEKLGVKAIRVGAVSDNFDAIGSTYIRNLIKLGGIERANELLGYNYSFEGVITNSEKWGDAEVFTIRLYNPLKVLPEGGLFSATATLEGKKYDAQCVLDNDSIQLRIEDINESASGLDIKVELTNRI